jgi:hypothetical protein
MSTNDLSTRSRRQVVSGAGIGIAVAAAPPVSAYAAAQTAPAALVDPVSK